jgi:hypothetical protein
MNLFWRNYIIANFFALNLFIVKKSSVFAAHQLNNNNTLMTLLKNEVAAFSSSLKKAEKDKSLFATHISLLAALFVFWQGNGFKSPFSVNRKELMAFSKIASVATYHKCMRELDGRGYIKYAPSFHPKTGSLVYWLSPSTSTPII